MRFIIKIVAIPALLVFIHLLYNVWEHYEEKEKGRSRNIITEIYFTNNLVNVEKKFSKNYFDHRYDEELNVIIIYRNAKVNSDKYTIEFIPQRKYKTLPIERCYGRVFAYENGINSCGIQTKFAYDVNINVYVNDYLVKAHYVRVH